MDDKLGQAWQTWNITVLKQVFQGGVNSQSLRHKLFEQIREARYNIGKKTHRVEE